MKRFFILASAAIVALASCAKTEVVYKDAPEEIAFKQITNVMTKAVDEWDTASDVMGLYAYEAGTTTGHLENAQFKKDGSSFVGWDGDEHKPYYWPLGKNLDFVVYAPFSSTAAGYDPSTKVLTYTVDNTGADQIDVLYGAEMLDDTPKSPEACPVTMKHALAWIQVNIKADQADVLKVNTFNLTGIVKTAKMNVNYTDAAQPVLSWTNKGEASNLSLLSGPIGTSYTTVNYLILPAATQTSFDMSYDLGSNTGKTWSENLDDASAWEAGCMYVYNIEVGASEIKIAPTVKPWDETFGSIDYNVEQ